MTEPDYADNGLRALLKLQSYHDLYQAVVDRMGAQIVEIAEQDPIDPVEPEKVGDIEKAQSAFPADRRLPVFNIEVAVPTAARAVRDTRLWRSPRGVAPLPRPGAPARRIRPTAHQAVRLRCAGRRRWGRTEPCRRRPGIIVIDPAFILDAAGEAALQTSRSAFPAGSCRLSSLHRTMNPLAAGAQVLDILPKATALPTEWSRRADRGVKSLDEFVSIVPVLVAEAERQYFRHRSSRAPVPGSSGRPRLGRAEGPDAAAAAQDP